jgi:hypothetical protein
MVVTLATGISTLGKKSMFSCRCEASPTTARAAIIMVAKTGYLMERLLRNMSGS